jgi:glycosidase
MVTGDYRHEMVNVADQLGSPDSLLRTIQKMIVLRKQHAAFGGRLEWLETGNPAVVAYVRENAGESIVVLNNLSAVPQAVRIPTAYQKTGRELFSNQSVSIQQQLELLSFSYLWIQI